MQGNHGDNSDPKIMRMLVAVAGECLKNLNAAVDAVTVTLGANEPLVADNTVARLQGNYEAREAMKSRFH